MDDDWGCGCICTLVIVAFFAVLIWHASGSSSTPQLPPPQVITDPTTGEKRKLVEDEPYSNIAWQTWEEIALDDWKKWMNEHRDCEIISIAAISRTQYRDNPTTGIIVVFKRRK